MGYYSSGDMNKIGKPLSGSFPGINTPDDLYEALLKIWCADTCAPRMRSEWSPENKTKGQCSITAFLAQDIFGGKVCGIPLGDGNVHCYNDLGVFVFDLTNEQFGEKAKALKYEDNPVQSRIEHFAKYEKKHRYELLEQRLRRYCHIKSFFGQEPPYENKLSFADLPPEKKARINELFSEHLDEVDFSGQRLCGVEILNNWVTYCDFSGAHIEGWNVCGVWFCRSIFKGAEICGSKFSDQCDFVDFSEARITDTEFIDTDFTGAKFKNAALKNTTFLWSDFYDSTDFSGCRFENVIFDKTDVLGLFKGAVFSNVTLKEIRREAARINIGTNEAPIILKGEEACRFIENGGEPNT